MAQPSDDYKKGIERPRRGRTDVRRFRATVEYDGTEFAGFQSQPKARTVQGELEAALSRLSGGIRQPVVGAGRTDAGVNDNGLLLNFASKNPDVEIVNEFKTGEEYGFSVKKGGNDALLDAINAVIADQATYDEIFQRWFGDAPAS